jgi:hypothetical protein
MLKVHLAMLLGLLPLAGEDFWKAKPYTEWNEKEVQRLLTNSPWAKEVSAAMPGGGGSPGGRGGRGGMRGGGGGAPDASAGMGGGESGGGDVGGAAAVASAPPAVMVKIRWQTALPVKQALVKRKFGAEAGTAEQAKQILAAEDTVYVVVVEGLPARMAQANPERMREALKKVTQLQRKGKEPILPAQVTLGMAEKTLLAYFVFPKSEAIELEDKDVEFVTKLGPLEIKRKFKLAEMTVEGRLSL